MSNLNGHVIETFAIFSKAVAFGGFLFIIRVCGLPFRSVYLDLFSLRTSFWTFWRCGEFLTISNFNVSRGLALKGKWLFRQLARKQVSKNTPFPPLVCHSHHCLRPSDYVKLMSWHVKLYIVTDLLCVFWWLNEGSAGFLLLAADLSYTAPVWLSSRTAESPALLSARPETGHPRGVSTHIQTVHKYSS